ncbi:putative uncharacterized protein DDB_G0271982 [Drosophila kikkawai]|uniref:Uncharacterized protein n=1 Tax=Drosophila kikkawai TaxID=30033 RepID=A0ABM4GQV0_DROKI
MVPSLLRISSTPPSSPSRIFIEDGEAISTSTLETTLINGGNDDDDDDVATTTTTNKPAPSPILNEDREVDTTLISEGDGTTTTTTTNKPAPSPIFNDDDNDDGTTTTTTNKPAPSPILFENGEEQSMRTLEPILPSTTGNESNTTLVMTRERLLLNSSTFETSTSAVTSTSTTTANTMADDSSSFKIMLGIADNDEDNNIKFSEGYDWEKNKIQNDTTNKKDRGNDMNEKDKALENNLISEEGIFYVDTDEEEEAGRLYENELIYMEGGAENYKQILPLNIDQEDENPLPPPFVDDTNQNENDVILMEGGLTNYTQIVKSNILDP